jgi:phage/plasmid-associated DNA primase
MLTMKRAVGYSLNRADTRRGFTFCTATGANGKGTFLCVLSAALSDYATCAEFSTLIAIQFALASSMSRTRSETV